MYNQSQYIDQPHDQQEQIEINHLKKTFFISYILIGINIAVFIALIIYQKSFSINISSHTLIKFGAKVNYLIADGEYYRLVTPMFLHVDIYHLVFNCIALNALGPDIEVFFGKTKFIIIYFISGIAGVAGSLVFNDSISAGASGAIFGLVGANLYLLILNPQIYKKIYGKSMIMLLAINIIYGIITPSIDNSAHLFGAIGGHLAGWILGVKNEPIKLLKKTTAAIILISIISSSIFYGTVIYKNSSKYNLSKAMFIISSTDFENDSNQTQYINLKKAYDELQIGIQRSPNDKNIQHWLFLINQALDLP